MEVVFTPEFKKQYKKNNIQLINDIKNISGVIDVLFTDGGTFDLLVNIEVNNSEEAKYIEEKIERVREELIKRQCIYLLLAGMRKGAQLKVDNGSLLVIKTKMEKRDDLKSFLVVYPGYYHVTEDRDSKDEDSVTLKVQYINYYFNYGERRRLKQSIEYIGGNLERIMILGRGPPWIREETKQSLTNGAIMAVITFLVSVGGSKEDDYDLLILIQ